MTLWESNIGLLKPQQSYQLNRLEIHSYQGKQYLAFPSTPSIDEITDLKETIEPTTSSDEDDEEVLRGITVSGIKKLETIYTCINCNKNAVPINPHIGECSGCNTTQKLAQPKQTAKLIIESATKKYFLKAHDAALRVITEVEPSEKEVSAQDLLYAQQFTCTHKYNVIKNIYRS